MAKIGNATFEGSSGKTYRSTVFPLKSTFKEGIGAVFLVTRRFEQEDGSNAHEWLYISSTADMREQFTGHHPMQFAFNKYKANAICVIRESDEAVRKDIYQDLRGKYMPLLNE